MGGKGCRGASLLMIAHTQLILQVIHSIDLSVTLMMTVDRRLGFHLQHRADMAWSSINVNITLGSCISINSIVFLKCWISNHSLWKWSSDDGKNGYATLKNGFHRHFSNIYFLLSNLDTCRNPALVFVFFKVNYCCRADPRPKTRHDLKFDGRKWWNHEVVSLMNMHTLHSKATFDSSICFGDKQYFLRFLQVTIWSFGCSRN